MADPCAHPGLAAVRAKIAALEAAGRRPWPVLPFGDPAIDACLPGGGLPLGRWHDILGEGMEAETCAAPAAFAALSALPLARRGEVLWVMRRDDLWAPGLGGLGFPAERLIQAVVKDDVEALSVMEDALSAEGVAAVVGEVDGLDLVAGRRLQLACEKGGATGFVVRRRPYGGKPAREPAGSAAATRWRVTAAPSAPAPGEFGLGPPRLSVVLERCRGGQPGAWIVEAANAYSLEARDGTHPLRLVAELADRQLAPAQSLRRTG